MPRTFSRCQITRESADQDALCQRVMRFQSSGGNTIEARLRLTDSQSSHVTRLMDELKQKELDLRFEWSWAEISLYTSAGEITDFTTRGPLEPTAAATLVHLIAKRCLKREFDPIEIYNMLIGVKGRTPLPVTSIPAPAPPVPHRAAPDPTFPRPPNVINLSRGWTKSQYVSSSSDSDSDNYSSDSSIDSSVGVARTRPKRAKARKTKRAGRKKYDSSESEFEDSGYEDVIKIKADLKKSDDIVKTLLELWTPGAEEKEKEEKRTGGEN